MTPRRSRIGRLLAALFIRGADAPFILRDLEDSFNHDAARATGKVSLRVAGSGYVATDLAADAAVPVSSGNGVVRLDVSLDAQDVRVFRLSQAAVR